MILPLAIAIIATLTSLLLVLMLKQAQERVREVNQHHHELWKIITETLQEKTIKIKGKAEKNEGQ